MPIPSRGAMAGAFLLLAFSSPQVHGADLPNDSDRAVPCRPTIACTAELAAPGIFEVEIGGLYASGEAPPSDTTTIPVLLKQTMARWLQLQVGTNGYTFIGGATHTHYQDNVFLGPKFHVLDQSRLAPAVAFSIEPSLPVSAAPGYQSVYDLVMVAYASKDFGPLHADFNQALTLFRIEGLPILQEYTALSLTFALPAQFGVAVEGYYFSNAPPFAPRDGGFRLALTQSPHPWLVLDCGADAGFFPPTRAFSVFAGFTVIPVVFWRPAR